MSQANAFSLANLPVGVYTLDVMTQKGNAKAAYEGILVISQQPTTIINETTKNIINQEINQNTRVDTHVRIIFRPSPPPGCPPGQVRNEEGDCGPPPGDGCPEGTTGTPPDCTPIEPPGDCPDGEDCPPGEIPPGDCPEGEECPPPPEEGGGEGQELPLPIFGGSSDGGDEDDTGGNEESPEDGDEGGDEIRIRDCIALVDLYRIFLIMV